MALKPLFYWTFWPFGAMIYEYVKNLSIYQGGY